MRKYIKASYGNGEYIGGKLFDIMNKYNGSTREDEVLDERAEEQYEYLSFFSPYYLVYNQKYNSLSLLTADNFDELSDIVESMAIKEGTDMVAYDDHIEIIGYYGRRKEVTYLFPISFETYVDLADATSYNTDLDESETLKRLVIPEAWGVATESQIVNALSQIG